MLLTISHWVFQLRALLGAHARYSVNICLVNDACFLEWIWASLRIEFLCCFSGTPQRLSLDHSNFALYIHQEKGARKNCCYWWRSLLKQLDRGLFPRSYIDPVSFHRIFCPAVSRGYSSPDYALLTSVSEQDGVHRWSLDSWAPQTSPFKCHVSFYFWSRKKHQRHSLACWVPVWGQDEAQCWGSQVSGRSASLVFTSCTLFGGAVDS